MHNVTAISGEIIRYPFGGYPIIGVRWLKIRNMQLFELGVFN